ncbi:MAG: helix-turn-helix transcriptional regulator [Acidobacteria bacterium]|nr:helix-turn-helix transcriptional regulator [Acidobacteriota bacterium]
MAQRETAPSLCRKFHHASELIGSRWTGAIIFVLLKSPCRFAALRAAIPDITDRMLSERLQELEREGIVERSVIPETPVRVEYALSRKGRELAGAIHAIERWADTWVELKPEKEPAISGGALKAKSARTGRKLNPRG